MFRVTACFIPIIIGAFSTVFGQQAQAVMTVKVDVVRGISAEQRLIKISPKDALQLQKEAKEVTFKGKAKKLIKKDSLLFYKFHYLPNQKLLFSVDPVQRFQNEKGAELFLILSKIGYSFSPNPSEINYLDKFKCSDVKANKQGVLYLWANARFYLPKDAIGNFNPQNQLDFKCTSM